LDKCPQGGDVGEVMFALRNLAASEVNVPKGILTQARSLLETGCVVNPSRMVLRDRERRGLPKHPSTAKEDVQKILDKTEFKKKIGSG
jgi:heterodisulfide reductase subunit C